MRLTRSLQKSTCLPAGRGTDMWYTYVILCDDNSLYKGHTDNIERRYQQHCNGTGANHTQIHKPIKLLYYETFSTQKESIQKEKYRETGSGREKLKQLLKGKNLL